MLPRSLCSTLLACVILSPFLSSPEFTMGQVHYVGDQSTANDNSGFSSFHDGLNWLNFLSPGGIVGGTNRNEDANGTAAGNGAAYFDREIDHRPNNVGGIPPDPERYGLPKYLYFGDFYDERSVNSDKLVPGGIAKPDSVRVVSGQYTFDLGSNNGGEGGGLTTGLLMVSRVPTVSSPFAQDPALAIVGGGSINTTNVQIGSIDDSAALILKADAHLTNMDSVYLVGEGSTIHIQDYGGLSTSRLTLDDSTSLTVENHGLIESDNVGIDRSSKVLINQNGRARFEFLDRMYGRGVAGEIEVSSGGELEILDEYFAIAGGKLILADSTLHLPNQLAVFDGADGATGHISLDHQAQLSAHYVNADRGGEFFLSDESSLSGYWVEVRSGLLKVDNSVIELSNRVFVTNLASQTTDPGVLTLSNGSQLVSAFQASLGNAQVLVEGGSIIQNAIGVPGELGYSPSRTASILARNGGENAVVRVEGRGSLWNSVDGFLTVGFGGRGTLEVAEGGTAKSIGGQIGRAITANGLATISGAGSSWQIEESLYVGGSDTVAGGFGKLVAENQGTVYIESKLHLWQNGTVDVGSTGTISVGDVEGNLSPGSVTVGIGGTLSGSGTIVGNTAILGGILAPGASPGKLNFIGDLSLNSDSLLQLEIGGNTSGLFDQLTTTGDLRIAGIVEFSLLDGYQPAPGDLFHLFEVGGDIDLTSASFVLPAGVNLEQETPGVFRFVAVPESHSLILALSAFTIFGLRSQRDRM